MSTVRAFMRVLLVSVLAGLGFAASPVGSVLAQAPTPVTIGQGSTGAFCGTGQGLFVVRADPTYVVPPADDGTITRFSFELTSINAGEQLRFVVLRPAGGLNYTVVGQTGVVTLAGTGARCSRPQ